MLALTMKWIVFTEAKTISTFEKGTGIEELGGTWILWEATKNETLSNNQSVLLAKLIT